LVLAIVLIVFFPPEWLMDTYRDRLPEMLVHSRWWDVLLLPHRSWALLFVVAIMLQQLARRSRSPIASAGQTRFFRNDVGQ
jgi:hypothetical protein